MHGDVIFNIRWYLKTNFFLCKPLFQVRYTTTLCQDQYISLGHRFPYFILNVMSYVIFFFDHSSIYTSSIFLIVNLKKKLTHAVSWKKSISTIDLECSMEDFRTRVSLLVDNQTIRKMYQNPRRTHATNKSF